MIHAGRTLTASTTASEEGIVIVNGNGVSGNPTIGLEINGLTASGDDLATTDELVMFDGTNNVKVTGQQIADGLSSILSLDNSAIFDSPTLGASDTYVTTAGTSDVVEVFSAGDKVADFVSTGSGDSNFEFDVATAGEVRIEAQGTPTDVDIRLVPKGSGQVFIGDTGDGVIQADDTFNLTVKGGDNTGGNVQITDAAENAFVTFNNDHCIDHASGTGHTTRM